jgi:hypothetical protein
MGAISVEVTDAVLALISELGPTAGDGSSSAPVVVELSFAGPYLAGVLSNTGYDHIAPWSVAATPAAGDVALPAIRHEPDSRVAEMLDGRAVAAVVLIDLFAAGPGVGPERLLSSIRPLLAEAGSPPLIVVEENPTHVDVIAEMLTGHTPAGRAALAGVPGVFGVTADQLDIALAAGGFTAVGRRDVRGSRRSVGGVDPHAASSESAPLGQLVRRVREGADDYAQVTDFVRAFAPAAPRRIAAIETVASCFLTVVIRSQGGRAQHLLEALTCLAAQTDDDLDVVVAVHNGGPASMDRVEAIVDLFDDEFRNRVRVVPVVGGRRGTPLAVGLSIARGAYAVFLDDDDHVTADWVEVFRRGAEAAPGCVVRCRCGEQHLRYVDTPNAIAEWHATSPFLVTFGDPWDFVANLYENHTPIHAFAVPLSTVRRLGITVDGETPILEDWGFLMRMAEVCGVYDTNAVTAIYQRWDAADRSHASITPEVWGACHTMVLEHLNSNPLIVPRGGALRVSTLSNPNRTVAAALEAGRVIPADRHAAELGAAQAEAERRRIEAELARADADAARATADAARADVEVAQSAAAVAHQRADTAGVQAELLAQRVAQFEESEWWRLTTPLRVSVDRVRRLFRRSPGSSARDD